MSLRPLIWTRPGIVALIPTVPVDVAPAEPWVAAKDGLATPSAQQASKAFPFRNPCIVSPPITMSVSDLLATGC
jgi:hypothetical protein